MKVKEGREREGKGTKGMERKEKREEEKDRGIGRQERAWEG